MCFQPVLRENVTSIGSDELKLVDSLAVAPNPIVASPVRFTQRLGAKNRWCRDD